MAATDTASAINSLNLNSYAGGFSKTTSNMDFASKLKSGVAQGASMAYQSVAPATSFIPGGAVMSSMLHNTTGMLSNNTASNGPISPAGPAMTGAPGNGGMFESMENLQQNMMSMNVYMLGLQQSFNDMNQKYTAVSNILKTKHDTEKNAISNFR